MCKCTCMLSSVQFSFSVVSHSLQPHGLQHTRIPCPSLSPGICSNSFPLTWWWPSNHLILCHPFLLLPSIFPSIKVFSNESVLCMRGPKKRSFSISPSDEYSELICFRIDWWDLCAVQGTLKSLLSTPQFKSINSQLSLQSNSHIHTWLLEKP